MIVALRTVLESMKVFCTTSAIDCDSLALASAMMCSCRLLMLRRSWLRSSRIDLICDALR